MLFDEEFLKSLRGRTEEFGELRRRGSFMGGEFRDYICAKVCAPTHGFLPVRRIALLWVLMHLQRDREYEPGVLKSLTPVWWKLAFCPWDPEARAIWIEEFFAMLTAPGGLLDIAQSRPMTPLYPYP